MSEERIPPPSSPNPRQPPPSSFELLISTLLRSGVSVSFAIIVLGTLISFFHHPEYLSSATDLQRLTSPGNASLHTLHDVLAGIREFHGQAIVSVGLILLIATPVLRVAVAIFAFLTQKDRTFAVITSIVLLLLLLSFFLGKASG